MPSKAFDPMNWDGLWRDLRFSARSLRLNPGFTIVAVLTLALGISATAAVFSIGSAVLLRPLPFRAPEQLVLVTGVKAGETAEQWPISYLDFQDWRRARSVESLAVRTERLSFKLREPGGSDLIPGEMVSANYFELLGVQPVVGRGFARAEDSKPGGNRVAVLSHGLWQRLFGGDRAVPGRTVELNEIPYTVIGVMPAGFHGLGDEAEVWLPISMATTLNSTYLEDRAFRWLSAVGRLQPGSTADQARTELSAIARQLEQEYPDTNDGIGAEVIPLRRALFGDLRPILWTLLGGSAFVLFIGCTNVANLLLAKAISRQREISLRSVLGAGRPSLIRQLLTESVLIALLGCALGLLIAWLSTGLLVRMSGLHLMSFADVRFDPLVLGVILGIAVLSALLFGVAPAFLASRANLTGVTKEGGRAATSGAGSRRLQSLLIVGEVALALILLLGAGLMMKAFWRMSHVELGFETDHLLTLRLYTRSARVPTEDSMREMIRAVLARVEALPGVASVALCGPDMPTDEYYGLYFDIEGRAAPKPEDQVLALRHHVSPRYFATLGVPVLRGRVFTPRDADPANGVVIVSATMAKRFWPGQDPLGKRLKAAPTPWLTVVGVVGDVRHNGLSDVERPAPDLYLSLLQIVPRTPPVLNLLVRTKVAPEALGVTIQRELDTFIPELPLYDVQTLEQRLSAQMASRRLLVLLMGFFSFSALLLAAVGIYGVISYTVAQRTREFGIRIAMGAQSGDVVRAVLARGVVLALIGIALGLAGGLALTRLVESRFYGANALDPVVLAGTSLLLFAVTLAANYLPARRAVRIDPLVALREQ
jgi:putative ABC transport system permease protein